jgi:hypothetical protein
MNIRICIFFGVVLVKVHASPTLLEPICQLESVPNIALGPSYLRGIDYTSLPPIRCGNVNNTQRSCSCPGSQVCYDSEAANLWSPIGKSTWGWCIGKECDDLAWWPPEQQKGCGRAQSCVHKMIIINAKLRSNTGLDMPGGGGRCLPTHPKSRCGMKEGQLQSCPKGWECIRDMYSSSVPGYCSPLSVDWWPKFEGFKPRTGGQESNSLL